MGDPAWTPNVARPFYNDVIDWARVGPYVSRANQPNPEDMQRAVRIRNLERLLGMRPSSVGGAQR